MDLKRKIYLLLPLPERLRKKIKFFYYNSLISSMHSFKNKKYYGKKDFFGTIGIETTTYCNLRCSFCPNSKYGRSLMKNKKLMDINLFKKIINELSEINYNGTVNLHFYGEPLTDKRLVELVAYTKEKIPKAKINIFTNGILLDVPFYKQLVDAGVDSFIFSQHTNIIPPKIKEVFKYLKTRPKEENKIEYRVFNENFISEDSTICNVGGEIEIEKIPELPSCLYPPQKVVIDWEGNVILCCNDYHSSIKFGNVKNKKLIDIWDSPSYKKIRKDLRNRKYNLEICKKCTGLIR